MNERRIKSTSCSTRFNLLLLLFVYSCLVNPSRGQILGDEVKEADKNLFMSQVLVKVKYHWRPVGFDKELTEKALNILQNLKLDDRKTLAKGSGTIIHPSWILTAANLFNKGQEPFGGKRLEGTVYYVEIIAGQHDQTVEGYNHAVSHVVIHRDYDKTKMGNDIALMQLENPLKPKGMVELPPFTPVPAQDMKCAMAGWGETNQGEQSSLLQWATFSIVSFEPSKNDWIQNLRIEWGKDVIATGMPNKHSTRSSGGRVDQGAGLLCKTPMERKKYLFGVFHGYRHGTLEEQGTVGMQNLFTDVFYHKEWIKKVMKRNMRSESTMFVKSNDATKAGSDNDDSDEEDKYPDYYRFNLEQL